MKGWSDKDTRAIRSSQRGYFFKRDVITDVDILTDDEMDEDPFYAEFLPSFGLRFFAAAMVSPDPRVEVALSIQRSMSRERYTEDELNRISRLRPHVERSLTLSMKMMNDEFAKISLGDALSRLGYGVFILDTDGAVVFRNTETDALLGDGFQIEDGRLRLTAKSLSEKGLVTMDGRVASRPLLLKRPVSGRSSSVHFLPMGSASTLQQSFLISAHAIVLVMDLEPGSPVAPSIVRDFLGLTLGEARVASLVGSGLSPRAAGEQLGITEETARTVLKRVYSKSGVSRQSELVALLARLTFRSDL
jgi:DNA-binding CsgD family transcriptional regulator